jgi:hypothetical protein
MKGKASLALVIFGVSAGLLAGQSPRVLLNERDFTDRVTACWLGKNIGGTLGMPFEGRQQIQDVSFYTNLKPGEPAANDDLDLQLLWLKAMEEHEGRVDARTQAAEFSLRLAGAPEAWRTSGLPERPVEVAPGGEWTFELGVMGSGVEAKPYRMSLEVGGAGEAITIPITLVGSAIPQR